MQGRNTVEIVKDNGNQRFDQLKFGQKIMMTLLVYLLAKKNFNHIKYCKFHEKILSPGSKWFSTFLQLVTKHLLSCVRLIIKRRHVTITLITETLYIEKQIRRRKLLIIENCILFKK